MRIVVGWILSGDASYQDSITGYVNPTFWNPRVVEIFWEKFLEGLFYRGFEISGWSRSREKSIYFVWGYWDLFWEEHPGMTRRVYPLDVF